jgi:hypothetical protein
MNDLEGCSEALERFERIVELDVRGVRIANGAEHLCERDPRSAFLVGSADLLP